MHKGSILPCCWRPECTLSRVCQPSTSLFVPHLFIVLTPRRNFFYHDLHSLSMFYTQTIFLEVLVYHDRWWLKAVAFLKLFCYMDGQVFPVTPIHQGNETGDRVKFLLNFAARRGNVFITPVSNRLLLLFGLNYLSWFFSGFDSFWAV
jgi:hypothetical protein